MNRTEDKRRFFDEKICMILLLISMFGLFFLNGSSRVSAANNNDKSLSVKRVLFISSYAYSWETVPKQIKGIQKTLGDGYVINYEFMDTKNTVYSKNYAEFYQLLKFKLDERASYDAVIVGDDAAFNFAMMYQKELFEGIPIIFEGVDNVENGVKAAQENAEVTGVVEQVDYSKNIAIASKMFPNARKLVFILDNAENGIGIQQQLEKYKNKFSAYDVQYINSSDYTQKEMCKKISEFDSGDICFYISMSQSKNAMIYTEEERFEMLREYSKIPMFRVSSSGVKDCIVLLGGYVVSHYESGKIAGEMVKKAIAQGNAADISVITDTPGEYYFDWKSIKKYGLDTKVIPKDATIINPEPTFLDKHYVEIISASIIVGIIILTMSLIYYMLNSNRIRKINAELDHKNSELEKVSEYKSAFLSNMSHEIRTPMNGIIGMTNLALDSVKDSTALEYLQEIDETSQYMLGVLNDVLDMSRIDSGKFELKKRWVNANGILWPCIRMIEPTMKSRNITFIHPDTNKLSRLEMYVDEQRVKQVVMNILNNAYKFTQPGGTVTIKIKNLTYDTHKATDQMIISDTGCGMSKDFLENGIFKPFAQDENGDYSAIRGTGLGLALVKQILTEMGGEVRVESELGKGSTFIVTIPYEYRKMEEENILIEEPVVKEDSLKGKRVLVAEDHPLNQKIVKALLEKEGAQVEMAGNGKIAVDTFQSMPIHWFDAILMDVRMPVMDGYQATQNIRATKREDAKEIPIIAMTANAFEEDIRASREAGMNAHLSKPIEPLKMFETIQKEMYLAGHTS